MKRLILGLSVVIGAWMLSPTPEASAWSWSWHKHRSGCGHSGSGTVVGGGGTSVPELDPSAAGSAMVLLLGGVAYIASRRRDEDFA
jgi:hypothetical protein